MNFDPITLLEHILPLIQHQDMHVQEQSRAVVETVFGANTEFWLRRMINFHPQTEQQDLARRLLQRIRTVGSESPLQHSLHIACLGPLQVLHHTQKITDWDPSGRSGARLTQSLLAYLAHCGPHGATEAEIMQALWNNPDHKKSSYARLRSNLSNILEQQRRHGESSYLEYNSARLRLCPQHYTTDVQMLLSLVQRGQATEQEQGLHAAITFYHQACQLYRGSYMEGVQKGYSWHQDRANALRDTYLVTLERLGQHAYQQRSFRECVQLCYTGLQHDFSDAELMELLLMALYEDKREAEATRAVLRYLEAAQLTTDMQIYQEDIVIQTYWYLWPHLR